jgi:hypothetical protein
MLDLISIKKVASEATVSILDRASRGDMCRVPHQPQSMGQECVSPDDAGLIQVSRSQECANGDATSGLSQ